jgi:hypothetical protein
MFLQLSICLSVTSFVSLLVCTSVHLCPFSVCLSIFFLTFLPFLSFVSFFISYLSVMHSEFSVLVESGKELA